MHTHEIQIAGAREAVGEIRRQLFVFPEILDVLATSPRFGLDRGRVPRTSTDAGRNGTAISPIVGLRRSAQAPPQPPVHGRGERPGARGGTACASQPANQYQYRAAPGPGRDQCWGYATCS